MGSGPITILLYPWIIDVADNYIKEVNTLPEKKELNEVRKSALKGTPLGGEMLRRKLISKMNLAHTTRGVGRLRNGS